MLFDVKFANIFLSLVGRIKPIAEIFGQTQNHNVFLIYKIV